MVVVENISYWFGEKCAVRNVSFKIEEGDIMVLLGPNGAGKTTIIRLLSSLLVPYTGEIKIYEYDVVKNPIQIRKMIGVVGETPGLYQRMNLYEYLFYFGNLYGIGRDKIKSFTDEMVEILGLQKELLYPLDTYSKGTKQKVSLVRALLHSPPVVFLDEPTSAMDPYSAKIVRDYILSLSRQKKIILVCTHNMMEAEYIGEKITIIKNGEIRFTGKKEELKNIQGISSYRLDYIPDVVINTKELEEIFDIKIKSEEKGNFTFEVNSAENINPYLIEYLVGKNVKIISCSPMSTSLEEAYFSVE